MSGLHFRPRSDHHPLATFNTLAVDSAMPSINPTNAMLAPSIVVRNTDSSG